MNPPLKILLALPTLRKVRWLFVPALMGLIGGCSSLSLQHVVADQSQGWFQWGGNPSRTAATDAILQWPLELKWRYRSSAAVMPSLLVQDQLVFITSMDGKQESLRLSDGKSYGSIRWRGGIPFTLAVSGNKLILLRRLGDKNLQCYDLVTGHTDWRKTVGPCLSEPLIVADRIYITTVHGRLSAYGQADGREVASAQLKNPTQSTPCFTQERIIVTDDQGLVQAFTSDLHPLWSYKSTPSIRATPAAAGNAVYLGNTAGQFFALDVDHGTRLWQISVPGGIHQSAAVNDSLVAFGCTDHHLYVCQAKNGDIRWRFQTAAPISTTPLICGNAVLVGSMDKTLYAVELASGRQIWSFTAAGRWRGSPVIAQGRLLCAAEDDDLYCFGAP